MLFDVCECVCGLTANFWSCYQCKPPDHRIPSAQLSYLHFQHELVFCLSGTALFALMRAHGLNEDLDTSEMDGERSTESSHFHIYIHR